MSWRGRDIQELSHSTIDRKEWRQIAKKLSDANERSIRD